MGDTPPEILEMQLRVWFQKPFQERLRLGYEMLQEGVWIAEQGTQSQTDTAPAIRRFKQLYSQDLPDDVFQNALQALQAYWG